MMIIKVIIYKTLFFLSYIVSYINSYFFQGKSLYIGLISEEFFHEKLRGFGGYGKTVKNISDHFNLADLRFKIRVILGVCVDCAKTAKIEKFHNAPVLLKPHLSTHYFLRTFGYLQRMSFLQLNFFLSMDFYPSYEYPLVSSPATPFVLWIRDTRSKDEWMRIATEPSALKAYNKKSLEEILKQVDDKKDALHRVLEMSKRYKRKVIVLTQGDFLIERARKAYGWPSLSPYKVYNPIPLPREKETQYSKRPSFVFLGRLDSIKRPEMVFQLAKCFSQADFHIVGLTHEPELMNPIIAKYKDVTNLKFVGHTDGEEKANILRQTWGLINTSVHEAFPVTFEEAFSFGKVVISCQNPDSVTEDFGYYTGEVLGDGLNNDSLDKFSEGIELYLNDEELRREKGRLAKEYVEKNHSFENFEKSFTQILKRETII